MGKLGAFTKAAKKRYGPGAVGRADTTPTDDRRLPSGSLLLDYVLGGGYRVGWITALYGKKSGGKTTTAIRALMNSQNFCRNCLRPAKNVQAVPPSAEELAEDPEARWSAEGECTCFAEGLFRPDPPEFRDEKGTKLKAGSKKEKEALDAWKAGLSANSYEEYVTAWMDVENSFAKDYAAKIGLDCRRVMFIRPESAEDGIDLLHSLACTVECDMLAVDSIAQLVPTAELEASTMDWQQGLQARLVNKMSRLLVRDASMVANQHRSFTQIWINQTRTNIGMRFGDPTVKPGGAGQEFAVHAEVRFDKPKRTYIEEQYGAKDKGEVYKILSTETFFFDGTKNKTASTVGVRGSYTQSCRANDAGPAYRMMEDDLIYSLAMHHLVTQDKKKDYLLAGKAYSNQKSIKQAIREDAELQQAVRETLLDTMLGRAA